MNKSNILPLIRYVLAAILGAIGGFAAGPATTTAPAAPLVTRCVDVAPLPLVAPVALSADVTSAR